MENQILEKKAIKDTSIQKSYKYLKRAFLYTLTFVVCMLLLNFDLGKGTAIAYILILLSAIFTPIVSLVGLTYGARASRQGVDLSNKEVWIILGNFILLVAFILWNARIIWLVFWEKIFAF